MLNRWVQGPDGAAPGGGAESETGRGSSLWRGGEGRRAALPWQQLRQRRADAVGDTRPEVWSGLGSSVEPDESEEETNKLQSRFFFSLSLKRKSGSLSRKPEVEGDNILSATWPTEVQAVPVTAKQSYHESALLSNLICLFVTLTTS